MDTKRPKGIITHPVYGQQLSSDARRCSATNLCQTGMQPRQRLGMLMFFACERSFCCYMIPESSEVTISVIYKCDFSLKLLVINNSEGETDHSTLLICASVLI